VFNLFVCQSYIRSYFGSNVFMITLATFCEHSDSTIIKKK